MKRTFLYVVMLLLSIITTSCVIISPIDNLKLSTSEVTVEIEDYATCTIESGSGDYAVFVANTNIATATLSGTTVIVEGINKGETSVKVVDKQTNQEAIVKAKITDLVYRMTFTTTKAIGEKIKLAIVAGEDPNNVWLDLNNNGLRDEGEGMREGEYLVQSEGGSDVYVEGESSIYWDYYQSFPAGYAYKLKSQTVTIYGKVTHINFLNSRDWGDPRSYVTYVDIRNTTFLENYAIELTSLKVNKNKALKYLRCAFTGISELDLSGMTELIVLDCSENKLTSLDVSNLTNLKLLRCAKNQLTSLDTSKLNLKVLNCRENQLTSLDLRNSKELYQLYCDNNQLASLDIHKFTKGSGNVLLYFYLIDLSCYENKLKGVAMKNLINNLPYGLVTRGNDAPYERRYFYAKVNSSTEQNEISTENLREAENKDWCVMVSDDGTNWPNCPRVPDPDPYE
ncbi:hypothetical protein [Capnocytophaga cynodegmi]|uniref:hypothetical protein n=1 Tax=Capnocytophaga cynodegmi TaxID=28189 RepID=UPI00385C90C6